MPATRRFLFVFLLLPFFTPLFAQQLHMPRNLARAYDQQTRAVSGLPGPKYWQNRAEYRIDVTADIKSRRVEGHAAVKYFNNSPDSLKIIRLKLAHDLWRKNAPRAYELAAEDINDGVDVKRVRIGGADLPARSLRQENTFLDLSLEKSLPPGQSLEFEIDWSHIAPRAKGTPRECVCDSTSWFVAYWYPQVAVYDDLQGWAETPYTGLQEMYNDFSNYTVRITVPGNVMVWATGIWQNAEALLQPEFLQRYRKALDASEVVQVFSPEDFAAKKAFFKNTATHTFEYKADGVPDFAFAFSDHYLWDATSALVDPATGRKAFVSAAYHPDSKDYYDVCRIDAEALHLMSTWLPGYPYPYPCMTVFNGDDGMEFPMMCNDASTYPNSPIGLTVHESSHTYFPFMMGINEQRYAWMDEGWAAFFDVLVSDSIARRPIGRMRDYPAAAGTDADMPPMTPSHHLARTAYRVASYNRPQAAYMALYQMLGYERFQRCMVEYMNRWKGRHPQPFDFFNTWNAAAGENLDWFWKPWFFDWGYPDLAVGGVQKEGVVVENRGTMPQSVVVEVEYADGSKEKIRRGADVWKQGNKQIVIALSATKAVRKVTLGDRLVSDAVRENDTWTVP